MHEIFPKSFYSWISESQRTEGCNKELKDAKL
jgi:hypothetical protein